MFSLDNICPSHTFVVKGLSQICPQDITKMLGSIDSNSGEWPQDFLCFLCYFSSEHKPLFIPIGLCFMKRHVWRVSYFFIKRLTKIETFSNFLNNHQKILENSIFEFSLRKFQNLNFHFMKPYSPNSNIIITTYSCIYLYIQQSPTRL